MYYYYFSLPKRFFLIQLFRSEIVHSEYNIIKFKPRTNKARMSKLKGRDKRTADH